MKKIGQYLTPVAYTLIVIVLIPFIYFSKEEIIKSLKNIFKTDIEPCDCVYTFVKKVEIIKECDEHYSNLNWTEKKEWDNLLKECKLQKENNSDSNYKSSLPSEIQNKVDRLHKILTEVKSIRDATDSYSAEQQNIITNKLSLLQSVKKLTEELESSGYNDQIEDFSAIKVGINLQIEGLKMQKEALEEMLEKSERSFNTIISFSNDQDVYLYLNGKTFYSTDHQISVEISNVIRINNIDAYFNLRIEAISENIGIVNGESMTNPNGTITIYVYPKRSCITSKSESYCLE